MRHKYLEKIILLVISCFCVSCKGKEQVNLSILSTYNFHSEEQEVFITEHDFSNIPYQGKAEQSQPNPLVINLESFESKKVKILVSKNRDFESSISFLTTKSSFKLYNFENETTYFIKLSSEDKESNILEFYNETSFIRNLYIDGATNARDLGNKNTDQGVKTNQGLIYRGGSISGTTDQGERTLVKELKIKTDLDLRNNNGEADNCEIVHKYINVPFAYNSEIVTKYQEIREVFDVFADKSNYPIYFHCAIGTDRTGFFAYLLNGILGVSKEDSLIDYLFSNFGAIGSKREVSTIKFYTNFIDSYGKETHKQNCIEYLTKTCGVSLENIIKIQNIMINQ